MRRAERLSTILTTVREGGSVSVVEMARRLGVSASTVRRDLHLLDRQRLLDRTHGGAVAHATLLELPLHHRAARHLEEKRRIGLVAAQRITDGVAVGLTGGTTTAQVARAIRDREGLTVVTNALNIGNELVGRNKVKIVMTGGLLRPESHELVGPLAEAVIERVHLDVLFLGVDGVDLRAGLTTHDEMEAHTDAALIRRARSVIVVADSSKFGNVAFAPICPMEQVQEVITDRRGQASEVAQGLSALGVKVSFA